MSVTQASKTTVRHPASESDEEGVDGRVDDESGWLGDIAVGRLALGLTLVPVVVGALALLFAVGDQYHPWSDHALIELQTRSVGRDEVLVGLYSRDDWNHPGPALFYVLAPLYRLTGGMSVSLSIGALLLNGASVAGMALIARRIAGTPLMLLTLLANALLMRMLGGDFLQDPWNCFVTTLPFGLLVFLAWAMWRGETWALPVGVGVFTFLAQTHVGFVALGAPLLAWGAVGLVASAVSSRTSRHPASDGDDGAGASDDEPGGRPDGSGDGEPPAAGDPLAAHPHVTWRRLARAGAVGAVVLALGWLPVAIDALRHAPSNLQEIVDYFRHPGESAHTLVEGWRVVAAQFGGSPEWLTYKHELTFSGQSPFIDSSPFPWMLVLLAAAGLVLWRRRVPGSAALVTTLAVTFALGVVAVSRTVGPAFDYRLRWTYIPPMVALVVIGWAGWSLVAGRWPRAGAKVLRPAALAGLAVLGGINAVSAATAGTPQGDDSAATAALTAQVLDHLAGRDVAVVVNDQYHSGAWHARGLLLQLEREGYEVGVHASLADEYGRHRVLADPDPADDGEVITLHVTRDEFLEDVAARPGMRMIAEWYARPEAEAEALLAEHASIAADMAANRIATEEGYGRLQEITEELTNHGESTAYHAAVFVEDPSVGDPPATDRDAG